MDKRLQVAITAAKKGGEACLNVVSNQITSRKQGVVNVVTSADLASNKVILNLLSSAFPNDLIISEENKFNPDDLYKAERLWIIDPLDGTNNFRFNRGYSAVSVGFVERGEPTIGAVYDIFNGDLYTGIKGKGAFLNNKPIEVGNTQKLEEATIATDNSYEEEKTRRNFKILLNLPHLPWILMKGSAVLVQCEIAKGALDLYCSCGTKPWDNAATWVIIKEAGGIFWDFAGKDCSFAISGVIVGNKEIAKQFLQSI